MSKPFITINAYGHDLNLTVWRPSDNFMITYEFERVSQKKHHKNEDGMFPWLFKKVLNQLKTRYGIENDFDRVFIREHPDASFLKPFLNVFKAEKTFFSRYDHHLLHAHSAYYATTLKDASIIAWDGGGDIGSFHYFEYKNNELSYTDFQNSCDFSRTYTDAGAACETFRQTRRLDISGKLMGFCAYGERYSEEPETKKVYNYLREVMVENVAPHKRTHATRQLKLGLKEILPLSDNGRFKGREELIISWAAQKAIEDGFISFLKENYIDRIRKSGNLIITGGSALNVLVNQKVIEEFPDLNVIIPSDPHDGGLSAGMMYIHPLWENRDMSINPSEYLPLRQDRKYFGPHIFDEDRLPQYVKDYNGKKITQDVLVEILRQGKIVGHVHGRCEVGPRALGNRSILCDPSVPNMKDTINKKVKFREWYRPFAPVCVLEDAPKYFDGVCFEKMDAMQLAPKVKPEWREELSAVTHVDSTARLQTVTETDNSNFYSLLKKFDGVLLNTSFNIQRRPILNTLVDALWMLDKTGLDHVVFVQDDGTHWLF